MAQCAWGKGAVPGAGHNHGGHRSTERMRERHVSQPSSKKAKRTVCETYRLVNLNFVPGKNHKASPLGLQPFFRTPDWEPKGQGGRVRRTSEKGVRGSEILHLSHFNRIY